MLVFGLAARRRLPPLRGLPHDLRRRRGAARPAGRARDRRPRDGRGPARRAPARACSSAATPGTTRSRSAPSRCACSSCSRRRPRPARRARTRAPSRTSRRRATPTTRCSARWPPAAPPAERLRVLRPARRALAARPRRAVRGAREHGAPHGRHARDRPRRGRAAHEHGGDEVLMALGGHALGAGLVRRRACTCSSSSPRTPATCRRAAATSTATPARHGARAICGIAPGYLP